MSDDDDLTMPPQGDAGEPPRMTVVPPQSGLAVKQKSDDTKGVETQYGDGDGGPPNGPDGDNDGAPGKRIHSDDLIQALKDSAPDGITFFRALLHLAFLDRCMGQPIDKNEADIFEKQLGCILSSPRIRVAK